MTTHRINPLIKEKLYKDVKDQSLRDFIEDILNIENEYQARRGINKEYEKILSKYVRMS